MPLADEKRLFIPTNMKTQENYMTYHTIIPFIRLKEGAIG